MTPHPEDLQLCVAIGVQGDERRALLEHLAALRGRIVPVPPCVRHAVLMARDTEERWYNALRDEDARKRRFETVRAMTEWLDTAGRVDVDAYFRGERGQVAA